MYCEETFEGTFSIQNLNSREMLIITTALKSYKPKTEEITVRLKKIINIIESPIALKK
jgi:hypothetical protein